MWEDEENSLVRVVEKQKKTFYQLTNELVSCEFSRWFYYILIVTEHLQILGFQCHQIYKYKGWGVQWFRTFTQFLNPEYYLKHTSLMDYLIPLSFLLVVLHIGLMGYSYYRQREKIINKDMLGEKRQLYLTLTHYMTVIMCTILTTPIFLTSILVFYCHRQSPYHPGRNCYNTYHLFLILLALLNIMWVLIINIYYSSFYFIYNPFNYNNILALSSPFWNLLKLIVKVALSGYLIFDQGLEYSILFVLGISGGLLGCSAIGRVLYPYRRYDKEIEKVMISIEIVSICISGILVMQAFYPDQDGFIASFIVSLIISVPLSNFGYRLIMRRKEDSVYKINDKQKDNVQTIEELLIYLIVELEDKKFGMKSKRFFGVIKLHHDQCESIGCPCHTYMKEFQQDENYFDQSETIYKILIQIIQNTLQTSKKAYSLVLLKAHIQCYKLQNPIKAAFIISKIIRDKINHFYQYLIDGFLYDVIKKTVGNTDMDTYRLFTQHLIQFEKQTVTLASHYVEYWHELNEQNTSLNKIINLLKLIKKSKRIIDHQFQILHKIYPKNIRALHIYHKLFNQVLLDSDQSIKYKTLQQDILHQKQEKKLTMINQQQIHFNPNQDLIVINTSVNIANDTFNGVCEIITVTNNIYQVLGYSSHDLVGKNINRFLPKIYAEFHDDIIDKYLNRDSSEIKPKEIIIFPLNSSGHLVECAMMTQVMPSLQYGVNIVSFLLNNKLKKKNIIIYDQRTGLVDSMSENAEILLLKNKPKKSSISIPDHIHDLLPAWDYLKEKVIQPQKKDTQQIEITFSNITLYRSDGPAEDKYVKVITFDLTFQSKMFSIKETDNQHLWFGIKTLVQIMPFNSSKDKESSPIRQTEQINSTFVQSANPLMFRPSQKKPLSKNSNIYEALPKWYPKLYLGLEILFLLGLVSLTVYNYFQTVNFYDTLKNEILVKQNIADASDFLLEASHTASQFVFSNNDPVILSQVNVENATQNLKDLLVVGQFIYKQAIQRLEEGEIRIEDLMVNISYYSSQQLMTIKSQTVTDASYQLVQYLLQIYASEDAAKSLPNNILFIFRNCLNISDEFNSLNKLFTGILVQSSQNRKQFVLSMIGGILGLFFVILAWQTVFKVVICGKINTVVSSYQQIPIENLGKFTVACEKFIKQICPVQLSENGLSDKTLKNIGNTLGNSKVNRQEQYNESNQLLQSQEQVQFISFSSRLPIRHVIFQSLGFLLFFSILFIVHVTTQNTVLQQNLAQQRDWNRMSTFRNSLIRTVYLLNQHKNRANQWSPNQLQEINTKFYTQLSKIEELLKSTTQLDSYLSLTFGLTEESVFIMNNNVSSQQFILNQRKIHHLIDRVTDKIIHQLIQVNIRQTVNYFLSMLQLIFIGQIIFFLFYAILYIPNSYKSYLEINQIAQLMHDLGCKLHKIPTNIHKNK